MRILFMGTPDFAAASLKAMTDAGLDVVGVVSLAWTDRKVEDINLYRLMLRRRHLRQV